MPHEPLTLADGQLLAISQKLFQRSWIQRRPRFSRNNENWLAYRQEQDFTHKQEWQSRETTPNFPIAVDQIVGSFERALTDSDDWLVADPPGIEKPVIDPDIIRRLMLFYMTRLWAPGNQPESANSIQVLVGDAAKMGILEPNVVVKVIPILKKQRHYRFETKLPKDTQGDFRATEYAGKRLEAVDADVFRLQLQLIPWEDYYPDPSTSKSYAIHRTRRRLHELLANPDYNKDVVRAAIGGAKKADLELQRRLAEGERINTNPDPYEVEVFECWGDIIDDSSGEILAVNQFWTYIASGILREPTDNPFWDGTRPFIEAPLNRVPGSNEPSALADRAVPMWRASNELLNLYIDGAFRATWGVGQVRPDMMEAPEEVADGVPQGYVAVLKPNAPAGQKFYERVDSGEIPNHSLEAITRIETKVNEGLAMPDTRLGQTSQRSGTKATELVQAMRASGSLYESIAARFEDTWLEPLFEKCWRVILQYSDEFANVELVQILGVDNAVALTDLNAEQRFQLLSQTHFKVRGLRGVASQDRQFTKLTTIINLLSSNEQFAEHFARTKDLNKLWDAVLRSTGIDPDLLRLDSNPGRDEADEIGDAVTEATAGLTPEASAAGAATQQLDPTLAPSSGASQPNLGAAEGKRGEASAFAPNNPNASGGATG